jgi:hypothetical protein
MFGTGSGSLCCSTVLPCSKEPAGSSSRKKQRLSRRSLRRGALAALPHCCYSAQSRSHRSSTKESHRLNQISPHCVFPLRLFVECLIISICSLVVTHAVMATRISQVHVPNVSFVADVCCKYFHLDFAKVDLDVAYTCMLQALFSSVFRCLIRLLQVFHLNVVYVCNVFQVFLGVFACVSDAYF